ncbi:tetratricopeptide repeat protein [Bacillus sp. Y1]|nr:tetratricopeptide repeat protein [Bacillus sp. Y1]AYA76244.1 tetratricopeptide repeat protein [Bacillus sp. Y1]
MALFKRKKAPKVEVETIIELDIEKLLQDIESASEELKKAEGEKRIEVLNKLGTLSFEAHLIDQSIEFYETSISENRSLGKAYTDLIKLYNIKRKEAVDEKDNAKIQFYLGKTDQLMQLTKDTIRGRF